MSNGIALSGRMHEMDAAEICFVSGGAGIFETIGSWYDNPGATIGKAVDAAIKHGQSIASPKGYWANGVYNIK